MNNFKEMGGKEYNVRISFDKDGVASVGWVQGFYKVDSNCVDFRPVEQKVVKQICKALGVKQRQSVVEKKESSNMMEKPVQGALPL